MAWFASAAWAGITVSKSFSPATIAVGGSSVLTISIDNNPPPGGTGIISFTDTYPANLKNAATPAASSDCGGTVTAAAGGTSLSFSGGSVNGNNVCTVTVTVTSTVAGSHPNSTGTVTTTNAGNGTAATATLTVTANPPTVAKSFSPSSIAISGTSTLTITLTNTNAVPIMGAAFIDNYPANIKNSGTPGLANTCGGTATAAANGTSLALSGGTIPAGESCSLTVQVTATASGSYLNSTGAVTTTNAGTGTAATATMTVASAAPSGFNAFETGTAAGSVSGVIKTKIAASAFSLAVVALKSSGSAVETAFAGNVKLELVDASAGAGCGAYGLIRSLGALTFTAADMGRKTLAGINEPNAWPNARIRMTYPATGVPTITACSTDNFAIRPASLAVSAHDNDWQSPGINRTLANMAASGGYVHKAGQPFALRATGINASNSPTGNYTGSPTLKTLACTLPTAPSTCINGILTPGVWSGSGTVTSSSAHYSEAGSFNLTLEDQTFANVDSADSTLLERTIPQTAAVLVGRFVPDHFELTTTSVPLPQFKTFNSTACATRSFTYIGQPFGYVVRPTATILAKDKDNNTLANYKGSLWKIGDLTGLTTPVVTKNCLTSPDPNTCVFTTFWDAASGSSVVTETYTYALTPASTPNWDDSGSTATAAGVDKNTGLISFIASDTLAFKRSNTTPQVLFTASITNVIAVKDMSEDGNCGVANCDITTTTPAEFSNIGFDSGNEFRFGRLVLSNAHGSELLDLPVPIEAQFWNGSGFTLSTAVNAADACTQLTADNVVLSNWQRNLNACETSVTLSGPFIAGRGKLKLSKPGAGNTGSVDLKLNLTAIAGGSTCIGGVPTAAAGASQTWLQGRWTGVDYDQNPAARASFGLYRGGKSLIYLREMY